MSIRKLEKIPSLKECSAQHRKDKVSLWSAVALQQHFSLLGSPHTRDIDTNVLPPPQPRGRLTLAQKMGLVPKPPPQPSFKEWKQIEETAAIRTSTKSSGEANFCSICFELLNLTMNQGQIILSCSHVFHELCFKQFEKLTRRHQRSEGNYFTSALACPECRQAHYHKKVYYAGKVLAQRDAIIKIQSAIRGFLARKKYLKARLAANAKFRECYIKEKLQKLSRAWEAYLEYRESERGRIIANVEAKKQEALAAYLTEKDWNEIIERRIEMDKFSYSERTKRYYAGSNLSDYTEYSECPICLEQIRRQVFLCTSSKHQKMNRESVSFGEVVVEGFRREYEQKKKRDQEEKKGGKNLRSSKKSLHEKKMTKWAENKKLHSNIGEQSGRKVNFFLESSESTSGIPRDAKLPSPPAHGPCYQVRVPQGASSRPNLILSCGHCFHNACLNTFERYSAWRAKEGAFAAVNRCPVCRSGYAVHPF